MTAPEELPPAEIFSGLPCVVTPARAAEILRGLGLTDMTECALKTRAYRKQIPFHLNGRRITFTLDDLREIAEGQACRPGRPAGPPTSETAVPHKTRRRRAAAHPASPAGTTLWRARQPRHG